MVLLLKSIIIYTKRDAHYIVYAQMIAVEV